MCISDTLRDLVTFVQFKKKNIKNTNGGGLLLVKMQAAAPASRVETFSGYTEETASIVCLFTQMFFQNELIQLDENCLLLHEIVYHLISPYFSRLS